MQAASARPHKLKVHNPALAASLLAQGGRLIADYGSFQLVETDDPSSANGNKANAEVADEFDFIQLNAGHLDTRAPEIAALRQAVGNFKGKRLHLVQFAGPLKPEWHDALEQSGARVVDYIPQNTLLVYGDAAALGRLQSWARVADFVQWEGSYADGHRIHPHARTTDPKVLIQYDPHPVIAYSGAQLAVVHTVEQAGLIGLDETTGGDAFWRDPARVEPHNLFVSTAKLRTKAAKQVANEGPPRRLLTFDATAPSIGKHVASVSMAFSSSVTATWKWLPASGRWERMLDGSPMTLDTGTPITAENVVIQQVVVTEGTLVDVLGYHSPEVTVTGTGKAWILRNGVMIAGKWVRPVMGAVTKFETKTGEIISFSPGNTWIELVAKGTPPTITK